MLLGFVVVPLPPFPPCRRLRRRPFIPFGVFRFLFYLTSLTYVIIFLTYVAKKVLFIHTENYECDNMMVARLTAEHDRNTCWDGSYTESGV